MDNNLMALASLIFGVGLADTPGYFRRTLGRCSVGRFLAVYQWVYIVYINFLINDNIKDTAIFSAVSLFAWYLYVELIPINYRNL